MKRLLDFKTLTEGTLIVGVDASAPGPFHCGEPEAPDFAGFDVDLIKVVAERLELTPKFKSSLWSTIFLDLRQGRFDVVCTAATITDERMKVVDFSSPYFDIELVVVVKKGSPLRAFGDLRNCSVGVRLATTAEEVTRRRSDAKLIRTYHFNEEAYKALQDGEIEAVIDDSPIARHFEKSNFDLIVAAAIDGTTSQYGIMFAKGNERLRQAINHTLEAIRADGTYAELCRRWFGGDLLQAISANGGKRGGD